MTFRFEAKMEHSVRPKQCNYISQCSNVETMVLVVMANTALGFVMA